MTNPAEENSTWFEVKQPFGGSGLQGQKQRQLSAAAELVFCQAPFKLAFIPPEEACCFGVSPDPLTDRRGVGGGGELLNNQDLFPVLRLGFRMCVLMRPRVWESSSKEVPSQGLGSKTLTASLWWIYHFNSTLLQTLTLRCFFLPPRRWSLH